MLDAAARRFGERAEHVGECAGDVGVRQHAHGAGRLARAAPADGAKTAGELYGRALVVIVSEGPQFEILVISMTDSLCFWRV